VFLAEHLISTTTQRDGSYQVKNYHYKWWLKYQM